MLVRAGSTLLVPRATSGATPTCRSDVADNATMLLVADVPPRRRTVVRARPQRERGRARGALLA
jgi:hypothetical protein